MGSELFYRFVKDWNEFMPMIQKEGIDSVAPLIVMKGMIQTSRLDTDTRNKLVKGLFEQFPNVKHALKEWNDEVSKLF